jgi:hypothetical protein
MKNLISKSLNKIQSHPIQEDNKKYHEIDNLLELKKKSKKTQN